MSPESSQGQYNEPVTLRNIQTYIGELRFKWNVKRVNSLKVTVTVNVRVLLSLCTFQ